MILAIETSCDETAAAVMDEGVLLSSIVVSQIDIHSGYGGVVPELASRKHLETLNYVIDTALESAGCAFDSLTGIAVTRGPGLVGSLLIGLAFAKTLSYIMKIPVAGVNHIEGHLLSYRIENRTFQPPFIALVVSGGHCELVQVDGMNRYKLLGRTLDDAVGEAFDKVAKVLGLGYPGGPAIDAYSQKGDPASIHFPRPVLSRDSLDFSFSGLKTAVANHVRKQKELDSSHRADIASSFQQAVIDTVIEKLKRSVKHTGIKNIVLGGGVASNSGLRKALSREADENGWTVCIPSARFCIDNAAMIAVAAEERLNGMNYSLSSLKKETSASPDLEL